ncbi:hypothetical protein GCM10017673_24300 [Streptosporangium violaceochromogenes]|nr:hypothetical protein GCM10017673_24300 [Streptosporangium violaceochromogenes]
MRTAISAGALALTLSGVLVVAAAPVNADDGTSDCGGGLLGEVTGGLCKAVGTVNDVVGGLTGGLTGLGGAQGSSAPPPAPPPAQPATAPVPPGSGTGTLPDLPAPPAVTAEIAATEPGGGPTPAVADKTCAPGPGAPGCAAPPTPPTPPERRGRARPPASPRPAPPRRSTPRFTGEEEPAIPLRERPRPPSPRPLVKSERREPAIRDLPPVIDAEAPRLELLWPTGPVMRGFRRTVTPTRSPDPLGTALTATLLAGAALTVRVLYVRRAAEKSMPLEPLRARRHRTA